MFIKNLIIYCSNPFEQIKSGVKTIELRLYDEKRQALSVVGDTIIFTNLTEYAD